MSIQSLEAERQAILQRMRLSRNGYRHMLTGDTPSDHHKPAAHFDDPGQSMSLVDTHASSHFPRSATMQLITRHPLACALGVAALIVIGPRRIARTVTRGSTAITSLTLSNQANIDLISRLLAMAAQYARRPRR